MTMNLGRQHSDNIWEVIEDLGNEYNGSSPSHWADDCAGKGWKVEQIELDRRSYVENS